MSTATLAEIRENFEFFDDWEDRYRYVIDLGKGVPAIDAGYRNEEHLVRGCQSQVWLNAAFDEHAGRLHLEIDSDAHIVRGLIAIVLAAYDNKSPDEILALDILGVFDEIGLLKHLSPTRGNGLRALIGRVRDVAASVQQQ